MQTTLLGLAIAIILALLAALVGPLFVDWGAYRDQFEARASRVSGLEFHVYGPIDARILPTPSLVLHDIAFGRPGEEGRVRARALHVEFALGALVRGEWKVADARLDAPEFSIGLDANGRLAWPAPTIGFDPEGVSIQRLNIENGRAVLSDAASGSRLVLEKLEFRGELRSLVGPAKGEGSFVAAGQHYPYRLAVGRVGEDGGARVKLSLDPIDRPLTAELDLALAVERGAPRYEGSLSLARPVGRGAHGGLIEPWRLVSRVHGDSAAAVLEQIEFQYGPDERPIKLRGDAKFSFGARPRLEGVLSSPQIDLDRVLALPQATQRKPLLAIKQFAEQLAGGHELPFPVKLGIAVESLTLAGAPLQRVSADLALEPDGWDIETLEFRAPGLSQVALAGRVGAGPAGASFKGRMKIDAADPRVLLGWLADRADMPAMGAGGLRLAADVALGGQAVTLEWLKLDLDRMTVSGHFAYAWAGRQRPARLDAALTAPEIDVDRTQSFLQALLGDPAFDWPREGALSLKVERATVGGVTARQIDVNARIDANGVGVERFTVADFGGAALALRGRIDTQSQGPRGALTLDLDARALDGLIALVDKFSPPAATELRRAPQRLAPLSLRASLAVEPAAAGAALARFRLDGRAGSLRVALNGDADSRAEAFTIEQVSALKAARIKLTARVEAEDAAMLAELGGLDRVLSVEHRAGTLALTAGGPLDGALAVDGQFSAGAFSLAAKGEARLAGETSPQATLAVKLANAGVKSLRPPAGGKTAPAIPASLSARLALSGKRLAISELAGTIADTAISGKLDLALAAPLRLDGELEVAALDLPAALAAAIGVPVQNAGAGLWPIEPFEAGLPSGWQGRVALKAPRVTLTPKLAARELRAVVELADAELSLREIEAGLAGGRLAGELSFARGPVGVAARGRLALHEVEASQILPGDGALSGRLTVEVSAQGSGRSPVALIGSLDGTGRFTLDNGRVARIDPKVFEALLRAVDQGLPIDAARVRDFIEKALAAGTVAVSRAEGALTVRDGQARLADAQLRADAELTVAGSANLSEGGLDARLVLSGPLGMAGLAGERPTLVMTLKGPFEAPKRTIDVAALSSWLALRAVEQQSQKLELLEGRAPTAAVAPAPAAVQPAAVPNGTGEQPQGRPDAAAPATTAPAAQAESDVKPRPATRPKPKPADPARPLDLRQFLFGPRS